MGMSASRRAVTSGRGPRRQHEAGEAAVPARPKIDHGPRTYRMAPPLGPPRACAPVYGRLTARFPAPLRHAESQGRLGAVDAAPPQTDLPVGVAVGDELGGVASISTLASGREGVVSLEQVLDPNEDPRELRGFLL